MQARLHDQMQVEMQTTRGLLDEVTFSANSLRATVDSTAAIIRNLASLTNFTRWIPTIGMALMVLFGLYLARPRHAVYTTAVFCKYFASQLTNLTCVTIPPT